MKSVPPGASSNLVWRVKRTGEEKYLSFDFRQPRKIRDKGYTSWGLSLEKTGGHLCGDVVTPLAGLYTLRIPDYRGERKTDILMLRNHNLALDMGDIICSREPPENRVEFTEADGKWTVRVVLANRCEDLACAILHDHGGGPRSFSADGKSFFELKPVDETCKVWSGEMPIPQSGLKRDKKGHLPRPFVRVTVLGGQIDRPLLTWLDR